MLVYADKCPGCWSTVATMVQGNNCSDPIINRRILHWGLRNLRPWETGDWSNFRNNESCPDSVWNNETSPEIEDYTVRNYDRSLHREPRLLRDRLRLHPEIQVSAFLQYHHAASRAACLGHRSDAVPDGAWVEGFDQVLELLQWS